MPGSSPLQPTTIKMDPLTKARVKHLAEARHRSPHWMIQEAIQQYVDREEKREAFRQAAIRAWNEYEMTGVYITQEAADEWLGRLAAGEDAEPPE